MKAKYIVVTLAGLEQPFVFSELTTHADVARALNCEVVGAGFCYIKETPNGSRYECYGESISLRIKSRGTADSDILNSLLGVTQSC